MSENPNPFEAPVIELYERIEKKARVWWSWEAEVSETEWLIEKWLPAKSCVWVFGKHGSGKSFAVLHKAMCLGTGQDWHGNRTFDRTGVVYWNGEKKARFGKRVVSWTEAHKPDCRPAVAFRDDALNLLDPVQLDDFIQSLKAMRADFERLDAPLGVVVLDTLARCIGGANVSDNATGNAVNEAMQRVIDEVSVTVICVAHVAKTEGADSIKGAGEFGDGADAYIRVEREKGATLRTLHLGKQSDGQDGLQAAFEMDVIEVGEGRQGPIRSLAVREVEPLEAGQNKMSRPLTPRLEVLMRSVQMCLNAGQSQNVPAKEGVPPGTKGVLRSDLKAQMVSEGLIDFEENPEATKKKLNRDILDLVAIKRLRADPRMVWIVNE